MQDSFANDTNVPTYYASVKAESLPLGNIKPYSRSFTVTYVPAVKWAEVPFMVEALRVTITRKVLISRSYCSNSSRVSKHVIILVREAIYLFILEPFSKSTYLRIWSYTIQLFEESLLRNSHSSFNRFPSCISAGNILAFNLHMLFWELLVLTLDDSAFSS
jgi:hypothetical protein